MKKLKIAVLAPLAWRVPPIHYGPWELFCSLLTEGLVANGHQVTLFASGDSQTKAKLESVVDQPFNNNPKADVKVWETLHIANCFEKADQFDIIHNSLDFVPLAFTKLVDTPVVTTIHGFSNDTILPVYEKYNDNNNYVSISKASQHPKLTYVANVYHGIKVENFPFQNTPDKYLLFWGRIHPDKGTAEAIEVAQKTNNKLLICGIIHDQKYFDEKVKPYLDDQIIYRGSLGGKEKLEVLSHAKALLHLISFSEPFGLSMIEANACGVPVIAYPKGSIPEVVENDSSGYVVNSIEEAISAVNKINLIDRQKVRDYVSQKFSIEKMLSGYEKVYETILS